MSLQIRLLQHNFVRCIRLRAFAYTTECGGNKSDRDPNDSEIQNGILSKLGRIWPLNSTAESFPVVLISKPKASLEVANTSTKNETSLLPLNKSDIEYLLFGFRSFERGSTVDDTGFFEDYIRPVSNTADDIYVSRQSSVKQWRKPSLISDSVISQENISVTLVPFDNQDNFLNQYSHLTNIDTSIDNSALSNENVLLCSAGEQKGKKELKETNKDLPTQDQIKTMKERLISQVDTFFKKRLEYGIYHKDIICENNFSGKEELYQGLNRYAMLLLKYRTLAHCMYTAVSMEVTSLSSNPEKGTITMKWRVRGLPQRYLLVFWRYTPFSYSKTVSQDMKWTDGISEFTLKSDGLIHKHRIDRVELENTPVLKPKSFASRLMSLLGSRFRPNPGLSNCSEFFMKKSGFSTKLDGACNR